MKPANHHILLISRPQGEPDPSLFKLSKTSIPQPQQGEVLVQLLYLSVDPYMRGRLGGRPSSHPPFELNRSPTGDGVGRVVESKSPKFKPGDIVTGYLEWAEYSLAHADKLERLDASNIPLASAFWSLGMPGMTAYFGMADIAQPKAHETIVISGAAGAVGMMAGQIAKINRGHVVGIAGTDAKVEHLTKELGFSAVNYKSPNFFDELKKACPKGVDIYFDNVGGEITDNVLKLINKHARIVLCGQISSYNLQQPDIGPRQFRTLIVKSATARGFLVYDYKDRFPEGIDQMKKWIQEGKIKCKETIAEGLENAPKAFLGLFTGENTGKQLVKVSS